MALPAKKPDTRMSFREFVDFENAAEVKHEFHDGEVLAMSGASIPHNRVQRNLYPLLQNGLKGSPCEYFSSDMRVNIEAVNNSVYPDATILCEPPRPHEDDPRCLTNPRAVLEVLSESTERYDRGAKFGKYRLIPSLEEYILIAQEAATVESFLRQPDGTWSLKVWQGLEETAVIRCLNLELPHSELYAGVEFEADD